MFTYTVTTICRLSDTIIGQLMELTFDDGYMREQLYKRTQRVPVIICRSDDQIVGWSFRDRDILAVFVAPNWRRHGIGKQLVHRLPKGRYEALAVSLHDTVSRRFYTKLGAQHDTRHPLHLNWILNGRLKV